MNETFARDLRSWLIEPDHASIQREPLVLDEQQKRLVTAQTQPSNPYRRIKGPAGSGKSLVLAARAAVLSALSREVLVVTYNMTLWHYLRDLTVRYPVPGRAVNSITSLHFHEWCKRVCYEAGLAAEHQNIWRAHFQRCKKPLRDPTFACKDLTNVLDVQLPALVSDISISV